MLEGGRGGGASLSTLPIGALIFGLLKAGPGGAGGLVVGTSGSGTPLKGGGPAWPIGFLILGLLNGELEGGRGGFVVGTSGSGAWNRGGGGGTTTESGEMRDGPFTLLYIHSH